MRGGLMLPEAGRPSIASVRYTPISSFLDAVAPLLVAGAVGELFGPEGGGVERDLDRLDGAVRDSEGPANPHLVSSGSQGPTTAVYSASTRAVTSSQVGKRCAAARAAAPSARARAGPAASSPSAFASALASSGGKRSPVSP